jgi:hypothetical protein
VKRQRNASFLLKSATNLHDSHEDNDSVVGPSKKARVATQMPVHSGSGSRSSQVATVSPVRNRKQQSIHMSAPAPVQLETVPRSPKRKQAIHPLSDLHDSDKDSGVVASVSPVRNRKLQSICTSAPASVQQERVTTSPSGTINPTRKQAICTVPSK